ncbi:ATP-binding cassette domain-containing protein [Patescibacteria group bacterium]|nr:MAG: ATP-binding cassette domain-containing protein [Patescibacteria group bacterium]
MIRLEKVSKIFPGGFTVLSEIDLAIKPGEFVSIVGQSGAGKSTLLKLIYAEEHPTSGRVYFNERPIDLIQKKHLPFYRRNIGTVFQDFKLLPKKTVAENIAYALEVLGDDTDEEIAEKVEQLLNIVGLNSKADMYPKHLSGGEAQKVSMARAMIHRPKVIIADEPTGNLDPVSTLEILDLLLKINSLGTTVLLATHNKDIVDRIQRRVVEVEKGTIVRDTEKGKYTADKKVVV